MTLDEFYSRYREVRRLLNKKEKINVLLEEP